jgi:hypothetical protein
VRIRLEHNRSSGRHAAPTPALGLETAYTFAEVLVAGAILGFVATSLYGAFAAGFCVIQSTRENLRATQIMMQKLEAVRLFNWSQITNTTTYLVPSFTEVYDRLGGNGKSGVTYAGNVTQSIPTSTEMRYADAYRDSMRTITVTVWWTNYNRAKPIVHQREMQTRVARYGMQNYIWGGL